MKIWKDKQGTSAVEYSILLFAITLAIIVPVTQIGQKALSYFNTAGAGW